MKQLLLYFALLNLFMIACNQPKSNSISEKLVEIQQKNIPDKRLMYWNIELETANNRCALVGATASGKAYNELLSFASKQSLNSEVELLPGNDFKTNPWGIVTLSVCNIRGKARHSAELITQALLGTPVKVFKKAGSWYLIQTPDRYFGWVDDAAVVLKTNDELAQWKNLNKVLYNKQAGFAYASANNTGVVECDLVLADLLSIVGEENGFYKTVLADGRQAFVKKSECSSLKVWKEKSYTAEQLLHTAAGFKGIPYLWGGTSPKMVDCSGFTKSVYYFYGVILQRDASQQTLYGGLVDTQNGYEKLQAGDLVFFGRKSSSLEKEKVTHVGLCLGNQEFLHASGKVRVNSLNKASENYTEHYETAFVRARRIIGNVDGVGIEWVVDNNFYKQILPE